MTINPKFIVTKDQVHFQPMHSSSSNTEGTYLKCTLFLRVDNVQKKMQNIFDRFLRPFCINSVVGEKNLAQDISWKDDLPAA